MTQSRTRISKAVIPAAGLGTRFLPATKATPKEMLPVVDKPAIQYVVEEAVAAGLDRRPHGHRPQQAPPRGPLRPQLRARGGPAAARATPTGSPRSRSPATSRPCTTSARATRRGLGHAVLCAAPHVGDEPFAVLLGDDLIDARDPLLPRMIEVQEQHGGSVVALMEVDPEQIHLYGCAAVEPTVRRATSSGSPTWSRSRTRRTRPATRPSSAATCSTRPSSTCCARPRPAAAARSSSPTRCSELAAARTRRRPGARRRLHGPPLRHRRPRRLPACRCPDSRANVRTWARTSVPGCAVTSPRRCSTLSSTAARPPTGRRTSRLVGGRAPGRHPRARRARWSPSSCSCSTPRAASWPRTSPCRSPCRRSTTAAMDGYAVRAADVAGATESTRRRCRSSATSRPAAATCPTCGPGQAARIMTGAPLPPGADAVVPVEWTDGGTGDGRSPDAARSAAPAAPGRCGSTAPRTRARARARQRRAGRRPRARRRHRPRPAADRPARRGRPRHASRVRPAPAGRRAVHRQRAGRARRAARPRPDLRLQQLRPHRRRPRGRAPSPTGSAPSPTTPRRCAPPSRTSWSAPTWWSPRGGVSVGAYDVVKEALPRSTRTMRHGVEFRKVAMQPGKPQGFGTIGPDQHPDARAARQPGQRRTSPSSCSCGPRIRTAAWALPDVHRPTVAARLRRRAR